MTLTPRPDPSDTTGTATAANAANAASPPAALVFYTAWLTESVRQIESEGPLEDGAALRDVARLGGTRQSQVTARAERLGQRLRLAEQIRRVSRLAPWGVLVLVVVVVLVGLALAGGIVDAADRRINVMAALVALLGAHTVTLLLWLLALAWPGLTTLGANPFGQIWWTLTSRVSLGRGGESVALSNALMGMLERARLLPWLFGLVSHLVWTLTFCVALVALLFALSFRHYTLGWETTLLDPALFVDWVQALAIVPGWFGFAVPDRLAPTNQQLAGWLIGCLIVYGLVPRAMLAVLSALVLRVLRKRLVPDWSAPYYRQLFARLDALLPATVVDADTHGDDPRPARAGAASRTADAIVVAGFELPAEVPWPPPGLPANAEAMAVDGSAAQRAALLDGLARSRPRLLVLVCDAASSPDRGTERLLREALPQVGECRLWLWQADDEATTHQEPADRQHAELGAARWRTWLTTIGFDDLRCSTDRQTVFDEPAAR